MQFKRLCLFMPTFLCLLNLGAHAIPNHNLGAPMGYEPRAGNIPAGRRLTAARMVSRLKPRGLGEMLTHEQDLHYIDADSHRTSSQFVAQVSISSRLPSVMLEELESHVDEVRCFDSSVHLYFGTIETVKHAYEELGRVAKFVLITSHQGCNRDGERDTYLVSALEVHEEEQLLVLSVSRTPWKNAIHSIKVDFGGSAEPFELRQEHDIRRRQATTSTTTPASTPTTSIAYPTPTASGNSPQMINVTENINRQWLDTKILPPDNVLGQLMSIGPPIPAGFTIACKNCSIHGNINLFSGSFSMSSTSNQTENIVDFFIRDNGYVELQTNDFSAHIELESTIKPSKQVTYTAPLPAINLTPFEASIPGIAAVGPQLNPQVTVGFELSTELDFTYGFDVAVPNNSKIMLNVGNVTNSSIQGFSDTKITALPFQAAVENVGLTVTAGFTPQLVLGISIIGNDATAGLGVFLDLPSVSATLEEVLQVNHKCEKLAASDSKTVNDAFGSLTHLTGQVGLGIGLLAQANLNIAGHSKNESTSYTAFATTYALPTACMSFDHKSKTYGIAAAMSTGTPTGSAGQLGSNGQKSGAMSNVRNPILKVLGEQRRVEVTAGFLMLVSAFFINM